MVSWGGNVGKEDEHHTGAMLKEASHVVGKSFSTQSTFKLLFGIKADQILCVRELVDLVFIFLIRH